MKAHAPAEYNREVVMAVRAVIAGVASEGQQKLAMDWIINSAANLYDTSYRDEHEGGALATAFHEGRRFVGNQIVKMTRPEPLIAKEAKERRTRRTRVTRGRADGGA